MTVTARHRPPARPRASCRPRLWLVLWHQLRSPLLGLLLTAAVASYFVGERSDAVIIDVIVALSVGLGFVNEYRAEKAAEAARPVGAENPRHLGRFAGKRLRSGPAPGGQWVGLHLAVRGMIFGLWA